jgi:hypothetical protein
MLQGEGKIAQFAALSSTGRNGNVTLLEARNTTAAMVVLRRALLAKQQALDSYRPAGYAGSCRNAPI